jgi:CRP/FNR family transcriptional regulator, dissimilatory nitrate respiration regulator
MIVDDLKRSPLFAGLSDTQLLELTAIARPVELEAGAGIFLQGESASAFFLLVSGRVKIFKTLRDGRTATLRHVHPGETFGESVLFNDHYPASADAMDDSALLRFPVDEFRRLLIAEPEVGLALIATMARLMVMLNSRIEELLLPVPARLARYVLDLRDKQCAVAASGTACSGCRLPTSKRELAARLGTVPETLSRTLDRFKRAKVIALRGDTIEVLDMPALERIAQR